MNHLSIRRILFLLFSIGVLFFSTINYAADSFSRSEPRNLQPIVFPADSIPELMGSSVSQLFLYAFKNSTQTWKQIPFQIDEKGWECVEVYVNAESTYMDTVWTFFGEKDGILESGDEICFIAKDMGDWAPETNWISNYDSKLSQRFELKANDPLDPIEKRYVYLYISNTLQPDPQLTGYLDYTDVSSDTTGDDIIYGKSYVEGHNPEGMVDYWSVPFSYGGSGEDFLDRVKYRVNVSFGFTIRITEDKSLKVHRVRHIKGLVRIIRQIDYWLVFPLFPDPIAETNFISYYYPYSIDSRGPSKKLRADWSINYMRQSFDLNEIAVGMTIHNPYNSGIVVDGVEEAFINTVADYPQMNWHLVTGTPGSFLMLYVMPDIGDTREIYYYDNAGGGTADGTNDTGDSYSYGDLGMAIKGTALEGSFGMSYLVYFLEADKDPAVGEQFLSCHENLLSFDYETQSLDMVAPAAITDLTVTDYTTQSITLRWTAPGDDGAGGDKVESYDLGYSRFPVDEDTLFWWNTAVKPKRKPVPATPGQIQTFAVTGLDAYVNYYFLLRSQDDAGNVSGFSNAASGTSYPVELSSFTVTLEKNGVVLQWETVSESNNLGFEIQRRNLNPAKDWMKLDFVKGAGTTNTHQKYSFVDHSVKSGEFEYRLKQIDSDGSFSFSNAANINLTVPTVFALHQNYPNPFNSETVITYQIAQTGPDDVPVQIVIYSVTGTRIRTLVQQKQAPGSYRVRWDGRDDRGDFAATGIYLFQIKAGEFVDSKKMLLIK